MELNKNEQLLLANLRELGEREQRLIIIITQRAVSGQKKYGNVTRRKKNWKKEGIEECADNSFYMANILLEMMEDEK